MFYFYKSGSDVQLYWCSRNYRDKCVLQWDRKSISLFTEHSSTLSDSMGGMVNIVSCQSVCEFCIVEGQLLFSSTKTSKL